MSRIYSHRFMAFAICLIAFLGVHLNAMSQCTATGLTSNAFNDANKGNTITADLSWDEVIGAQGYQVTYVRTNGTSYKTNVLTSNSTSLFNLVPNTTYAWRVRVLCNNVWSSWNVPPLEFNTPDGTVCETGGLSVNAFSDPDNGGTITAIFTWDDYEHADGYQVNYQIPGGTNIYSGVLSSNTYTAYNLDPNSNYQWRVRSQCYGSINVEWPPYTDSFTTPEGVSCEADGLTSNVFEDTENDNSITAELSWNTLATADAYQVNYWVNGVSKNSSLMTNTTYTLTNLLPGATYYWRVRVSCNGNLEPWPNTFESFETTPPDVTPPTVITQNITRSLDETGMLSITPDEIDNGSTDETSGVTLALNMVDFDCTHVGDNTVTLTVTDEAGNAAEGTAVVTIVDDIAPVAISKNLSVALGETGNVKISPDDIDDGSHDACGIATVDLSQMSFDCSNVGENQIELLVTDNNGNIATALATVTITDDVAPTVSASLDIYQSHHKRKHGHHPHDVYQVNYSASDVCNAQQEVDGIILIPDIEGYRVKLKRRFIGQRVKIDSKNKKITVYARRPQVLYESIVENGGIKVFNESYAYMRLTNGHKHEYNMIAGWLYAVSAPEIVLQATATDESGNTAQAFYALGETLQTDPANARTADPILAENISADENVVTEPQVYPIPSAGTFNINFDHSEFGPETSVSLYSVSGTLVDQKLLSLQNSTIQMGNDYLKEGVYLIKVEGLHSSFTKRVLVKRN